MWAHLLLAADDPLTRPEILYGIAGLVAALLVGAVVISLTDKWRKRAAAPEPHDETDMLTTYRDMYEHGEITEAEYAELRRKIAEKVKIAPVPAPVSTPAPGPLGRPDPVKLTMPAPPVPGAQLDPPAPLAPPPEPPAAPETS